MRDPDRTTLEFERNDGGDEPPAEPFSGAHIGWGVSLDHVGVRTRAPHERHLDWAARNLGFTLCVSKYVVNPDPLKNGRPMVTRSPAGADINFIPNGNTPPPEPEGSEAPLFCGGVLKPGAISPHISPAHAGILYATFTMDPHPNPDPHPQPNPMQASCTRPSPWTKPARMRHAKGFAPTAWTRCSTPSCLRRSGAASRRERSISTRIDRQSWFAI